MRLKILVIRQVFQIALAEFLVATPERFNTPGRELLDTFESVAFCLPDLLLLNGTGGLG